jgi:hypothetical protein
MMILSSLKSRVGMVLPGLTWRWSTELRSSSCLTRKESWKECTGLGGPRDVQRRPREPENNVVTALLISCGNLLQR